MFEKDKFLSEVRALITEFYKDKPFTLEREKESQPIIIEKPAIPSTPDKVREGYEWLYGVGKPQNVQKALAIF